MNTVPEKVRCSIDRKWFVDSNGNPANQGTPVFSWCEDHKRPVALLSVEDEKAHDAQYHGGSK